MPMEDQGQKLAVYIEADDSSKGEAVRLLLGQVLEQAGDALNTDGDVRIVITDEGVQVGRKSFRYPLRLGSVMDAALSVASAPSGGSVGYLDLHFSFGRFEYIGAESVCVDTESNERVRLTDKERDMLGFLYKAPDHKVRREDLLEMLWGYSKQVETHTIETHIYRLRQKIESDPSKPTLLVTEDDSYRLNVDGS